MSNICTRNYSLADGEIDAFLSLIEFDPFGGCWLWSGPLTSGYGRLRATSSDGVRQDLLAHRVMYVAEHGEVPPDMTLDHKCRVRCCVNPAHLEPKSWVANLMMPNSDCPAAVNSRKTHCKRGHELTPENTYLRSDTPHRQCLTCRRESSRQWMMEHRSRRS